LLRESTGRCKSLGQHSRITRTQRKAEKSPTVQKADGSDTKHREMVIFKVGGKQVAVV